MLSSGPDIGADLLPDHIVGRGAPIPLIEPRGDASLFDVREECERHIIVDMLEKCGWNVTATAEYLGVPLSTLKYKMDKLEVRQLAKRLRGA